MAGRGMLFEEGPTACPFVALESDRDRRAGEPDPRHRCYAEPTPAPRALAHQREFCLSPGFGGCPIFQDWAIRAAARPVPLRPAADSGPSTAPPADPPPADPPPAEAPSAAEQLPAFLLPDADRNDEPDAEQPAAQPAAPAVPPPVAPPRRPADAPPEGVERIPSLPLDTAAEPGQPAGAHRDPPVEPAPRRRWEEDWPPAASAAGGPAGPATDPAHGSASAPLPSFLVGREGEHTSPRPESADRPPPASRRVDFAQRHEPAPAQARPSRREEWSAQRADLIPAWQRERYAAYPTLGRRLGVGDSELLLSRLTRAFGLLAIIALVIAAIILLPDFLGGLATPGSPSPSPSPTATVGPTASPTPAPTPEPTIISHRVAPGETLFGIAVQYDVTVEQILAANPTITNPNLIQVGQLIIIPPDDFPVPTLTPAPSPTG